MTDPNDTDKHNQEIHVAIEQQVPEIIKEFESISRRYTEKNSERITNIIRKEIEKISNQIETFIIYLQVEMHCAVHNGKSVIEIKKIQDLINTCFGNMKSITKPLVASRNVTKPGIATNPTTNQRI